MKGEFTTQSHSDMDAATKGVARDACRPDLDLSPGKDCLHFKVIFQLNTTGEAKLTDIEITYREKNKRTNGFLVLACIITCVLRLN